MKNDISRKVLVFGIISLLILISIPTNLGEADEYGIFAPGEVIVKFYDDVIIGQTGIGEEYTIIDEEPELNAILIEVEEGTEQEVAQTLEERPDVEYTELNYIYYFHFEPNDPLWDVQYGPKNINCPSAWDIEMGSSLVKVAVIDSGIDNDHPDLKQHYCSVGSWDFANHDWYPEDEIGHGTHCAGIIAARINNEIGIAGIANVKIMVEKVGKVYTIQGEDIMGAFPWNIARGIIRAATFGADILSMSLGGWWPSPTIKLACEYAYNLGCLLVASSGNGGNEYVDYPSRWEWVISVGAVDEDNVRADFSDYGLFLEMMGPGVDIMSTMPTYHVYMNDLGYTMDYSNCTGTSMACPHVAGGLALYYSRFDHPDLVNPEEARTTLQETAIDLGDPGYDYYYGYGLVDVSELITNSVQNQPDAVSDSVTVSGNSLNNQINVLTNDVDIDGNALTITSVSDPAHGFATTDGAFVFYSPDPDYIGMDSFTYTISDGTGGTDIATVSVTVTV